MAFCKTIKEAQVLFSEYFYLSTRFQNIHFFGLFLSLGFINIHPKYHEKLKFAVLNIFLRMFKIFIRLNIAFKGSPFDKDLLLLQNPNLMTLKLIHLNLYLNFKKMICVGFSS